MTSNIGSNPSGQLPTSVPSNQNEQDQPDNCGICLEPMLQDEVIKKIACGHFFDQHCIDEWLKVANTCPLCKRVVDLNAPKFKAPEMTHAEIFGVPDNQLSTPSSNPFLASLAPMRFLFEMTGVPFEFPSAPVSVSPSVNPHPHPMPLPRLEVDNQDVRILERNDEPNRHSQLLNVILDTGF